MKTFFVWVTMAMLLVSFQSSFTYATNAGFTTEEMKCESVDTVLANSAISLLTYEPQIKAITCFDVNENGAFVIGDGTSTHKAVCVYSENGTFQYGYTFKTAGTFGVELEGEVLRIYLVRSDIVISLNNLGEPISVCRVENTLENNARWQEILYSDKRVVGNTRYIAQNGIGFLNILVSAGTKLIAEKPDGTKIVVYDAGSSYIVSRIVMIICITLVVFVPSYSFIKTIKERRTGHRTGDGSLS